MACVDLVPTKSPCVTHHKTLEIHLNSKGQKIALLIDNLVL